MSLPKAAVVVIIKDGLILGISRKDNPNLFGLIGGKLEDNETAKEAAIRECFEECGIKVKECEFLLSRYEPPGADGKDFQTFGFYATEWSEEPSPKEGLEVKWLTVKEICETNAAFPAYNQETIKKIKELFPDVDLKES